MLAKNWKRILIAITIILCLMNVIVKLNLAMPFIKQLNSVVTREVFTEDEINKIKEEQIKNKLLDLNNKTKTVELNSEGKYIEAK
jgi:hypothetical protein